MISAKLLDWLYPSPDCGNTVAAQVKSGNCNLPQSYLVTSLIACLQSKTRNVVSFTQDWAVCGGVQGAGRDTTATIGRQKFGAPIPVVYNMSLDLMIPSIRTTLRSS